MKQVNQEQFDRMRAVLAESENLTKEVPISAISLTDRSFADRTIEIGGATVNVSPNFFSRLASMLKINSSLTGTMMKNEDGIIAMSLMNALKDYRQSRIGGTVLLIANPKTQEIVDVCEPKRYRRLTNDSLFDVTERILNQNPSLNIETIDTNTRNGGLAINLLSDNEVGFPGAGKDEFFKFGFSIIQNSKDTMVEMYNQRLVCSNGLRISLGQGAIGGNKDIQFQERFRLNSTSGEDIRIFLNQIEEMRKANFVPSAFQGTLANAVNTKASLLEVETAMIRSQQMIREADPDLRKNFVDTMGRKYFDGYADTMARIVRKGQDPMKLSDKQKSYIRTSQSIWDVVNSLTYLGSNNSGLQLENKHELKAEAGHLFGKGTKDGFDLQFADFAQL